MVQQSFDHWQGFAERRQSGREGSGTRVIDRIEIVRNSGTAMEQATDPPNDRYARLSQSDLDAMAYQLDRLVKDGLIDMTTGETKL